MGASLSSFELLKDCSLRNTQRQAEIRCVFCAGLLVLSSVIVLLISFPLRKIKISSLIVRVL